MRYLLDATFAIDFLRGQPAAMSRLRQLFEMGDDAFINDVVVCEVATGSLASEDPGLSAFIGAVEYIQPGHAVAELAGRWRGEARRRGVTLSAPDALIAASAHALGAVLLTRNARDFVVTPVRVEAY